MLGRGHFSTVLLVNLKEDEKCLFALKLLKDEAQADEALVFSEIDLSRTLASHALMVPILRNFLGDIRELDGFESLKDELKSFDFKALSGRVCYLLEYSAGGSLADEIDRRKKADKPFEPAQAVAYCLQLCAAVAHMHSLDRVHADIKPGNVLLCPESPQTRELDIPRLRGVPAQQAVAKLADFGAAVHATTGKLTDRGRSHHVPEWFAKFPCAADAYAVAWVLVDLLSLEHTDAKFQSFSLRTAEDVFANRMEQIEKLYPDDATLLYQLPTLFCFDDTKSIPVPLDQLRKSLVILHAKFATLRPSERYSRIGIARSLILVCFHSFPLCCQLRVSRAKLGKSASRVALLRC